jgi:uncharacterized protein involved in type VI secretion and phage assembly
VAVAEMIAHESALEAGGHVKGVAVAVVRQNKDDSGMARVRVSYPWHDQPRESHWARVASPMTGNDRGAYFLPEIDDEVLVVFERGDLRFPYIIGGLWNGKDKSPANNSDGKNDKRVIKTRKGHVLEFDDGNRGSVLLKLNDGKKLHIDDDGMTLADEKGNTLKIDSNGGAVTLEAKTSLTLKAPQVTIEGQTSMDIKSSGNLAVKGGMVMINCT